MTITFFYITVGSESESLLLGKQAVENRLAACANVFPIHSVFTWKGNMEHENEFVLVLKTLPSCQNALCSFILDAHSYELPCIMSWDVQVNEEYGNWVAEQVRS